MGLRKLLTRQPAEAEDPLERFAELGRAETLDEATVTRVPRFAPLTTQTDAVPTCLVGVDKRAGRMSVLEIEKGAEPRRRSAYVWRSQRNRNSILDKVF